MITAPRRYDPMTADFARELVDQSNRTIPSPGPGSLLSQTPVGTSFRARRPDPVFAPQLLRSGCPAEGGGDGGLGCIIVGAKLYADGFGAASTGTATVFVLELAVGGYFPAGSRFWVSAGNARMTGGETA